MNAIESETHHLRHFFFSNKGRDSLWFFCFDFPGDQQGSVLNFVDKVDLVWQKSAFPKLVRKAFLIGAFLCAPLLCLLTLASSPTPTQSKARGITGVIIPPPPPLGFLFVVTSTGDGDNTGVGAVCDDGTGNCTLRAAIEVANANTGDDTIKFDIPATDPGYDVSTGRWTINLTMPLPDLSSNIRITGPGADKLTVQRSGSAAQFRIFNVTTTGSVTLSDLTIANGVVLNGSGGGIFNNGGDTLNLSNVTLKNNFAGQGGGIFSQGGTINATNSILTGNSGNIAGGGIYSQCFSTCTVTLTNCTVSGNFGAGGGIFNTCGSGSNTLNVINSTVSGNSGRLPGGGGIFNSVSSGSGHSTANITNSTIAGNFNNLNDADGGGIYADFSTVNLTNSTISGNSTTRMGGGIFSSTLAIINVKNSIVAVNSAIVSAADVSGGFISQGNNLVGARDGSTGFTAVTDHTGTVAGPLDVKLDPAGLQNNGGPTHTIALRSGSLAINNADPAAAPARDQRGFVRNGPPDIEPF